MRIYHFSLIFALFAVIMIAMTYFSLEQSDEEQLRRNNIDIVLDRASESAADVLKEAHASGVSGMRDLAVDAFYSSLAAGLGLADTTPALAALKLYVPVIVVADEEVMFVCYDEYTAGEDGNERLQRQWSKSLAREETDLEECLEYYCGRHNETARRAGITYEFAIPDTEGGLYFRSGSGPGFFALFQGYPSYRSDGKTYNGFSFAGTGIDDAEQFFINVSGEGLSSERFFHRKECIYLTEESIMFNTKKKCAGYGAYECPVCGD